MQMGRKMSCSSNRYSEVGSCIRTLVSHEQFEGVARAFGVRDENGHTRDLDCVMNFLVGRKAVAGGRNRQPGVQHGQRGSHAEGGAGGGSSMALRSEEVTNCIQRGLGLNVAMFGDAARSTRHDFDQPAGRWVFATALDNSFCKKPIGAGLRRRFYKVERKFAHWA